MAKHAKHSESFEGDADARPQREAGAERRGRHAAYSQAKKKRQIRLEIEDFERLPKAEVESAPCKKREEKPAAHKAALVEEAPVQEPENPYGTVFSLGEPEQPSWLEPAFVDVDEPAASPAPERQPPRPSSPAPATSRQGETPAERRERLFGGAGASKQKVDPVRVPHRGAETGKPRNKREDRRRAQEALANPDIFPGLTPTGTNCPDPNDPHVRARALANQSRRKDLQGEKIPGSFKELLADNWKNILIVVLLIVVVVALVFAARAFVTSKSKSQETQPTYVSPYTWTNLDRTDGRYRYIVDGQVQSKLGIDVSENQLDIDWSAVAKDGIDFAIVRLGYRGSTEGGLYLDNYYLENIDGARAAGLDEGVYFFSQATTVAEAREEAAYVLAALGGRALQYPVAFDSEVVSNGRTADLSDDEMTEICEAFCQAIEEAGYQTIVYGNTIDLARYNSATREKYGVWYAEYNMPSPTASLDFTIWQYSNGGDVAGISTAVDMNLDLSEAYASSPTRQS